MSPMMERDGATTSTPLAPASRGDEDGGGRRQITVPPSIGKSLGATGVFSAVVVLALAGWVGVRVKSALEGQRAVAETRDNAARVAAEKASAPVFHKVVRGTPEQWQPRIPIEGTLAPVREAAMGFRVQGRINSIRVKVGDKVMAGQVLGTLDASEAAGQVAAAEAQLRASEAQLAVSTDNERRISAMVERGAMPEAQGVQAHNEKALSQANADGAKARLELARVNLAHHTLATPFAGVVTKAPTGIGGVAVGNGMEFHVSDLSELKLVGSVGESDAPLVAVGESVEITTAAGVVVGKVSSVLGEVDAATRRVPVEALVDNRGPTALFANTMVRAVVRGKTAMSVLRLPRTALRPGSQDEVLVVRDGVLSVRHISFVYGADGALLCRGGLDAAEEVLLAPTAEAKEGDKIAVDRGDHGGAK